MTLDARIGWDSAVKAERNIPVAVWLDVAQGKEIRGLVRVIDERDRKVLSTYSSAVTLTPPSRKRVDFTVPYSRRWPEVTVQFYSPRFRRPVEIGRTPRAMLSESDTLIVVVGKDAGVPAGLRRLWTESAGQSSGEVRAYAAGIEAADLSDRWADYEAVDLIILGDIGDARLPPAVTKAMAKWVLSGGGLLVTGGLDPAQIRDTPLWPLLPVSPTNLASMEPSVWSGFGIQAILREAGLLIRSFEPRTEVPVKRQPESAIVPALVGREAGGGWVGYTPLVTDPAPGSGEGAGESFWSLVLRSAFSREAPVLVPAPKPSEVYGYYQTPPFGDRFPLGILAAYLGGYLLLIGPINYLFLRWRKRFHLVWVTVPVLSVAFFILAYVGGYLLWGNRLTVEELAIVEVFPRVSSGDTSSPARYVSRLRVNSPSRGRHDVGLGEEVVPVAESFRGGTTDRAPRGIHVVQGAGTRVVDVPFHMWSSRTLYVENADPVAGGIGCSAIFAEGVVKGSVTLDLAFPLEKTAIYYRGKLQHDPPTEGGRLSFEIPAAAGPGAQPFRWGYQRSGSEDRASSQYQLDRALDLLEQGAGLSRRNQPYFIGVRRAGTHPVTLDGREVEGNRFTVYLAEIPFVAVEKEITVPPDLWREVVHDDGNIVTPGYQGWEVRSGTVSWEFHAPAMLNLVRPSRIEIVFPAGIQEPNRIEVFDWQARDWRDLRQVAVVEGGKASVEFGADTPVERYLDAQLRRMDVRLVVTQTVPVRSLNDPAAEFYLYGYGSSPARIMVQILVYGTGLEKR